MTDFAGDEREEDLSELVGLAGKGDERAFGSLVERLESRIRRWAARLSSDADSADDLTQLTLIRLHERAGQFDRRSRVTTWLYGMMRNLAADARRADARRMTRERHASFHMLETEASPAEESGTEERHAAVLASYHTLLSVRERQVFEFAELRGMSATEVGSCLQIAPATVRVLLLRARRKLRAHMLEDLSCE